MEKILYNKCMNAAAKYLRLRGWNVLECIEDEVSPIQFIAQIEDEDDELITGFFMLVVNESDDHKFEDTKVTRGMAEGYFIDYMMEHPDIDTCHVEFNEISMCVTNSHQAALRLHTNIFNQD